MLKQRIITALVLMAFLLPAIFSSSPIPFTVLVLLAAAAAAWEWGRLNGFGQFGAIFTAIVTLLLCAASWHFDMLQRDLWGVWLVASAAWVLGAAFLIKTGVPSWAKIPQYLRWLIGVLALWVVWVAIAQARAKGIHYLLSLMALVWVADIAAYCAGRTWGLKFFKNKLAPAISPGKSWEGAVGGVAGVLLMGVIWVAVDASTTQADQRSYYSHLLSHAGWLMLLIALVFLAAMSIVGDLVESLIKRSAGMKDSSQLLPGHGGVLDRIDALLPVMPVAMMLMTVVQ